MHDAGAVQDGASVVVRVPHSALARSQVFRNDDGGLGQAGEGCADDVGKQGVIRVCTYKKGLHGFKTRLIIEPMHTKSSAPPRRLRVHCRIGSTEGENYEQHQRMGCR